MSDQVEPIFKAIEFIEGHLHEDLTVAQIADATGYSLFHFMRKFNQMVHHTPYDYLMRRRLSEAARALVQTDLRIIDIACDYGFNDQETFSRVFRRMFQMTPSQCRKQNGITSKCLMAAKTIEDLQFINGEHFHPPRMVDLQELVLVGLMTVVGDNAQSTIEICKRLVQDLRSAAGLKPNSDLTCMLLHVDAAKKTQYQFVGAQKTDFETLPPLLVSGSLPAGRYLCMDVPESELGRARGYLYSSWLPGAGLEEEDDRQILRLNPDSEEAERSFSLLIPIKGPA
jgi:AraC family transcriptional regulator